MRRTGSALCFSLLALVLVCAPATWAQQEAPRKPPRAQPSAAPSNPSPTLREDLPRFSVEARLVVLHATVLDKDRHLVTNLSRDNFKVYEDNVEQKIKDFKREDIPVSVGILIDNSGSMREKRAKVNAAALVFVRTSNSRDEVFIVNFNDEAFLDKDFTSDIEELKEGLEKIDARGGTAYYDAIQMSLDHLTERGQRSKKALLAITDGEDNASRISLEQLVKYAQQAEAVIYTVGLLSEENNRAAKRARKAMMALSEATGGAAFFAESVNDVESIAARIAHDIRNQYVLTYTPSNASQDGGFRSVAVKASASGKGKLFVRTRTGYYPSGRPNTPSTSSED